MSFFADGLALFWWWGASGAGSRQSVLETKCLEAVSVCCGNAWVWGIGERRLVLDDTRKVERRSVLVKRLIAAMTAQNARGLLM